jgi:hypothetical protein
MALEQIGDIMARMEILGGCREFKRKNGISTAQEELTNLKTTKND